MLAVVLMLAIHALPLPPPLERAGTLIELTANGKACLAIMAFAVTLWVTETLPFAVTSLLIVLLIPLFAIADFRAIVRAGFGDPIITFFIGVLLLSAAFTRSGLGTRLVYQILKRVGTRTDHVLLGVLSVGTLISWWITDMAVAAMLLPLGVGLLRDASLRPAQQQLRPRADDRHRVRSADRRHRHPGRHGGQPRGDLAAEAARQRRHLVHAVDAATACRRRC